MSIIQVLKNKISSLEKENQQLKSKVVETEQDIKRVTNEVISIFDEMGFKKIAESQGKGSSSGSSVAKVLFAVGKKFITKQISIEDLKSKWKDIKPVFEKYKYIIEKEDGNANS